MEWLLNVIPFLQAGGPTPEEVGTTVENTSPGGVMGLLNEFGPIIFIVIMIIVMYFFVMRPQSKAQKEKEKCLKSWPRAIRSRVSAVSVVQLNW
jgi:flagellar biosynthesis/type III secretory pathway M-ring protein FliF/YscJ